MYIANYKLQYHCFFCPYYHRAILEEEKNLLPKLSSVCSHPCCQ